MPKILDTVEPPVPENLPEPMDGHAHPYAEAFPLMEGNQYTEFLDDIRQNGVVEPIVFLDGAILDGRNRFKAAAELDIDFPFEDYTETDHGQRLNDPLGFVVSRNLKRRHMDSGQRGIAAARLANMPRGGSGANQYGDSKSANLQVSSISQAEAAAMLNVSERTVATAAKVLATGAPELVHAVETKQASVSAAAEVATLPKAEQTEIVAKGEKAILAAAKDIKAKKAKKKRTERLETIEKISKGNTDLKTDVLYPVLYIDPPWQYENSPMGGDNRAIENQYPTMTLDEIKALPVGDIAFKDAMLYIWATAPKLEECMQVITAWGFEYRTNMVWDKVNIGMGYHVRGQHELLLIAKRGEIPPPEAGTQPSSIYSEKREEHSAKPEFFYQMIEAAYPNLPKIELFARNKRDGWDSWGNQA